MTATISSEGSIEVVMEMKQWEVKQFDTFQQAKDWLLVDENVAEKEVFERDGETIFGHEQPKSVLVFICDSEVK